LAEMLGRLTPGEKKEFARLVDLDELVQLKADVSHERRIGNPKVYVGTTPGGLSLELPVEHVIEFIRWLADMLVPQRIEIFTSENGGSKEYSFSQATSSSGCSCRFVNTLPRSRRRGPGTTPGTLSRVSCRNVKEAKDAQPGIKG